MLKGIILSLMSRSTAWISCLVFICSCRTLNVADPVYVHGREMRYYTDSGKHYLRLVFTDKPCDSIKLLDSSGNELRLKNPEIDSNCYTCDELSSEKGIGLMDVIKYKNKSFHLVTHFPVGNLSISTEECSKFVEGIHDKWGDSIPIVIWHELKQERGVLIFYLAEESYRYPYFKKDKMDSLVYDLNKFCSDKDKEEEDQWKKEFFQKHIIVGVTPNPFTENFTLTVTYDGKFYRPSGPMTLDFIDENGNQLLSRPVEFDKNYTFEFPDIYPGRYIYYRLTWDDCVVSGQVLKAN
jgi:hypothetical protein